MFVFAFTSLSAFAADNQLNAVILEGTDDGYNITLKADEVSKVKKISETPDKLTLIIRNVSTNAAVNVVYRNTPVATSLIVENSGRNDVKVHIKAGGIENSNIIFDIPASAPIFLRDSEDNDNLAFNLFAIGMVCGLLVIIKSFASERKVSSVGLQSNFRDRELELYRNYSRKLNASVNINSAYKRTYSTDVIPKGRTIRQFETMARR